MEKTVFVVLIGKHGFYISALKSAHLQLRPLSCHTFKASGSENTSEVYILFECLVLS